MILVHLHIDGFGKIINKDIDLSDKLNIFYGYNEAGKSTLHTFVKSMLYGLDADIVDRYRPWSSPDTYGGSIKVSDGDKIYIITRDFNKSCDNIRICDASGTSISDVESFMTKLYGHVSKKAYSSTACIDQLATRSGEDISDTLSSYIKNLNTTGDLSLDASAASDHLLQQKSTLLSGYDENATSSYESVSRQISDLEEELSKDVFVDRSREIDQKRSAIALKKGAVASKKDKLIDKINSEKQYLKTSQIDTYDDVTSTQADVKSNYENYKKASHISSSKGVRIAASILLILISAILIFGIYLYVTSTRADFISIFSKRLYISPATFFISIWVVAVVLLVIVFFMIESISFAKKKKTTCEKNLSSLIFAHTGEDLPLSDESISVLLSKLDTYKDTYEALSANEDALSKIESEMASLKDEDNKAAADKALQDTKRERLELNLEKLSLLREKNTILQNQISENERIDFEIKAIDIAINKINSLALTIYDSYGYYLNKQVSIAIASITNDNYDSVDIDDDFNIYLDTKDRKVPADNVSTGTIDQVYLAIRLSAARLLAKDGSRMPLLLDDVLINYDEERMFSTLNYLAHEYGSQILLFTCRHVESDILKISNIPYNEINL